MSLAIAPEVPPPPRRAATPAQQAASRANGARSHGPVTPEGRDRCRRNALKRGPTGLGVVLPPAVAEAAAAKAEAYAQVFQPADEFQRDLVQRAALAAVRLTVCMNTESALLQERVYSAIADRQERIAAEVEEAAELLQTTPARGRPVAPRAGRRQSDSTNATTSAASSGASGRGVPGWWTSSTSRRVRARPSCR